MYTVEIKKNKEEDNGDEVRSKLVITHKSKELHTYYDGGEPEDNYFFRDWSWVADELQRAYELGKQDAKEDHGKNNRG